MTESFLTEHEQAPASCISPTSVIDVGKCIFIADRDEETEGKRAAATAVQAFQAFIMKFPEGSNGRQYLESIMRIALEFSNGMYRRKRIFWEAVEAAKKKRQASMERIGQKEKLGVWLKTGFHLVMFAGIGYFIVKAIFPFLEHYLADKVNADNASIAFALGCSMVFTYFKTVFMFNKLNTIDRDCRREIRGANQEYGEKMHDNYVCAAEAAQNAWKTLTDREPPLTSAFRRLLIDAESGGFEVDKDV
ncbi:MAG: hypothetical protein ISS93_02070 [Candidatus Aenigmarchaeota archaeon]|nr:hypothetical protein [Candidatus Aenigmarchaeota archaeon]